MRTKVNSEMTISSWEEANEALRQIGENNRDITAAETVMNEQIANAKAAADAKCKGLQENTKLLAQSLKEYVTLNRKDLGKLKSKQLTFGTVSFRQSTKIGLPKGADELAAVVERLRAEGMTDCVVQPPAKIDRNVLKKYSAEKIASVGASAKTSETFGYEIDCDEIAKL